MTAIGCHPLAAVVGLAGLAVALIALGRALDPR